MLTEPIHEPVDKHAVLHFEGGNHRFRWDEEGLDEERLDEQRQPESDEDEDRELLEERERASLLGAALLRLRSGPPTIPSEHRRKSPRSARAPRGAPRRRPRRSRVVRRCLLPARPRGAR